MTRLARAQIRDIAYCHCGTILQFHVVAFSNGQVAEYCPTCAGQPVHRFPIRKIEAVEVLRECKDCHQEFDPKKTARRLCDKCRSKPNRIRVVATNDRWYKKLTAERKEEVRKNKAKWQRENKDRTRQALIRRKRLPL